MGLNRYDLEMETILWLYGLQVNCFFLLSISGNIICSVFVAHPWLRDENPGLLLDFSVYKLVKSYIRVSPFRRSALKVVS